MPRILDIGEKLVLPTDVIYCYDGDNVYAKMFKIENVIIFPRYKHDLVWHVKTEIILGFFFPFCRFYLFTTLSIVYYHRLLFARYFYYFFFSFH